MILKCIQAIRGLLAPMTMQSFGIILGVLGFFISVYNWISAIRHRTVNPQPELLAELRGYIETAANSCQQLRPQLNFDRHLLDTGHRPQINSRPTEFDTANKRMPELARTVTSVSQSQIELLQRLIQDLTYNWDVLIQCVISDPINVNALEFSGMLKKHTLMVKRIFPTYVDDLTAINKGNIWKRFKYRDHRDFTYKVFRWKPLNVAIREFETEYERALRE
jgi:hypothetical protein